MRRLSALALLVPLATAPALVGQETGTRPLTLADYASWNRITQTTLSPDGRWLAYAHDPNEGDATLFIREIDGSTVHEGLNGADVHPERVHDTPAARPTPSASDAAGNLMTRSPMRAVAR